MKRPSSLYKTAAQAFVRILILPLLANILISLRHKIKLDGQMETWKLLRVYTLRQCIKIPNRCQRGIKKQGQCEIVHIVKRIRYHTIHFSSINSLVVRVFQDQSRYSIPVQGDLLSFQWDFHGYLSDPSWYDGEEHYSFLSFHTMSGGSINKVLEMHATLACKLYALRTSWDRLRSSSS